MNFSRVRYQATIFVLDRSYNFTNVCWDEDDFFDFLNSQYIHYGLHLVSDKMVSIVIEYSNITWNYQVYFGSCKKKFSPLSLEDARWERIEKQLFEDLKMMGLDSLYKEVISHLKEESFYSYYEKSNLQFKRYCI